MEEDKKPVQLKIFSRWDCGPTYCLPLGSLTAVWALSCHLGVSEASRLPQAGSPDPTGVLAFGPPGCGLERPRSESVGAFPLPAPTPTFH